MGSVSGLSRLLSFEEQQLHLEVSQPPPAATAGLSADGAVAAAGGVAAAAGGAAQPGSPAQRQAQVAELQGYLNSLGVSSRQDATGGLVEFPTTFRSLVQQLLAGQRDDYTALRGWLFEASVNDAGQGPEHATASAGSVAAAAHDAKLAEAMEKMKLLDGALLAADQRAAAVASAGRELEQRMQQAGVDSGNQGGEPGAVLPGGLLAAAMMRERRRLQQAERLREALADNGLAPSATVSLSNSGGSGTTAVAAPPAPYGSELSPAQEALVEALLLAGAEESGAGAANPYEVASFELADIDTQLAALGGAESVVTQAALTAAAASMLLAPDLLSAATSEGQEDDLAAIREDCVRAQQEARASARILRSIDTSMRALRTGSTAMPAC